MKKNEQLTNDLVVLLKKFPLYAPKDEESYAGLASKNARSTTVVFKSGSPVKANEFDAGSLAMAIPARINEAMKDFASIRDFVFEIVTERARTPIRGSVDSKTFQPVEHHEYESKFDSFDVIPLAELRPTRKNINAARTEAYIRRRVIFSLGRLCALNPKMYFDNELFKEWFQTHEDTKKSNFYKAIQIEPAMLQTEIGLETLQRISFWNRENTVNLAIALDTRNLYEKTGMLPNDTGRGKLILILFMIKTFLPKAFNLSDSKLQEVLNQHRIAVNMDGSDFRKIRKLIHKRKT